MLTDSGWRSAFRFIVAASLISVTTPLSAAIESAIDARPLRPVHTYSIVARDGATGQLGVAVQSHWGAVGGRVTLG